MTKADSPPIKHYDDDKMRPEYDLSKIQFVRGKHAHRKGQPHSVTIHNGDGTATVQQFDGVGNMTSERQNVWTGDRITGDKVAGDKVMGNKVQIGTVQGDAVAGNKIVNSQNLTQAAQEIKTLLDQLTIDHPNDDAFTQAGRAIGTIKNNPTLKKRVTTAVKEFGKAAVEQAIEAVTDNRAVKVLVAGIEGFVEAA